MKKISCLSFILFLLLLPPCAQAQAPWDIAYHSMPVSFTPDIPEEVTQFMGNAQSTISQGKSMVMNVKTDISNLQSAINSTFAKFKSIASGNIEELTAGFCGTPMKMVKAKKISKKVKKTFLFYKSPKGKDKQELRKIRKQFYYDNLYAIYALSVAMKGKWEKEIVPANSTTKDCVEGGGDACKGPSTDEGGKNEVLYTYQSTLEQLDKVMAFWEQVAALKARLIAVKSIYSLEPELEATKKDTKSQTTDGKKSAFILPKSRAVISSSQPLAFAQVSYKKFNSSLANVEAAVSGSNSPAMSIISGTIEFVSPAESPNQHPLAEAQDKIDAISELNDAERTVDEAISVHNMIRQLKSYKESAEAYANMLKTYDSALAKLQESEQCSLKYLRRYFNNPVKVWSGINLGKNVNKHELRKGISGWAIEAYETAKAAETSTITASDIGEISLSADEQAALEDDPVADKATAAVKKIDVSINTSKKEATQDENRKSMLMPWQIGSEAAKMLGADGSKWGSSLNKPMVWTDTKNFYNQYLQRKYENVKAYLKMYTRNDVLALVVSKLKGQDQDISDTKYQKSLTEENAQATADLTSQAKTVALAIQKQKAQTSTAVGTLEKQRQALVAEMDKLNEAIIKSNREITDIRSAAEDKAFKQIDERVNAKVSFPVDGAALSSPSPDKLVETQRLNSAIADARNTETNDKKIKALQNKSSTDKKKLEALEKQLEDIDNRIAQTKLNAQEGVSTARDKSIAAAKEVVEKLAKTIKNKSEGYGEDVRKNLMAILSASAKKNPLIVPSVLLARAEVAADASLSVLYKQVDAAVDSSYAQMLAMGDKLYTAEAHPQIIEIHNQMMDKIKGLMLVYSVSGLIKVDNIAIYAKLLTADTSAETEGFFVGSTAGARDMKAPFALPNFDLPPVREVFHFDAVDFKAVKPVVKGKTSGRSISASDFLNAGGDIPKIWQYMLTDKAFIESDYNLKEALNAGCEDVAFSRGGIMPCIVAGSSLVLDVNEKGEYLRRTDINSSALPKCLLVKMKKGKPHHSLMDSPVIFSSALPLIGKTAQKPKPHPCTYSELGMLLEADDNNNLKFRERAFTAYTLMLDNQNSEKMSDKEKNRRASAGHAMLNRNQIGDFLSQVEYEKTLKDSLNEQKQKYDAQMKELKQKLESYGFKPSAKFDLSKPNDYNLASGKLKSVKNKKISTAQSAVAAVTTADNAPAKEKSDNLKKLLNLMKKDTEAVLDISGTMVDANDLEAQLKKASADTRLVDKYKKSLKEQAKDYNDPSEPFCANY